MPKRKFLQRLHLDWPLLGKELREQSARKQMYVVRVIYAVVLFGAFCFYYMRHLAEGPVLVLGRGMGPFNFLVMAQLLTIYLFLPPLMAGALAQEKERDTLGLLFLTDLTPWELILQKFFGRLIPMLTLLFLSLPLLAVAYSLGGVSTAMLYSSAATLFLTCLWVGALALECSAHEATTFQALIRCWGICLLFAIFCSVGPFQFFMFSSRFLMRPTSGFFFAFPIFFNAVVFLVATFLFLARAKYNLETRAFIQRRNPFGHQFKRLDQYWKDLRKLIRAMSRTQDREARALAEQIIRREMGDKRNSSPGKFMLTEMQVPHLLAFAIIFGAILLIALVGSVMLNPKSGGAFNVAVGGLWILALLTVPIQGANTVASERINERLGAILTTPLTAREMLDEWLGPLQRWIQFLVRPLIVLFVVEGIVKLITQEQGEPAFENVILYLVVSLLTVWIYPKFAQWLCLLIGFRIRNQIRALMTSFLLVVAWCIIPIVLSDYLTETGLLPPDWGEWLRFISPVTVIDTAETIGRSVSANSHLALLIFANLGAVGAIAWMIRRNCLANADRYLGRI